MFLFYFKEPFLTSFSTVCPRRRTPSAGFALSVPIWASSLLKARAPRRERPARLRRRLSPCRFSPLAAPSAGGLGAASEAAPVRPYPKTTSSEDQGPAQEHRRGNPLFCWLVSAVRCAVVGRCLSWRPLGLSCRVRAKTILSLAAEGLLAGRFLAASLSGDGFGGGVDRCDFGFAVGGGDLSRTRIFLVAGRRAAGSCTSIKDPRLPGHSSFSPWRPSRSFPRTMRRSASGRSSLGSNTVLSPSDTGGGRGFTSTSGFLRFAF